MVICRDVSTNTMEMSLMNVKPNFRFLAEVTSLESNLNSAVARLKTSSEPMDDSSITRLVDGLWQRVDGQLASVKSAVENEKRFRMLVARRRYAPRIKGVSRLKQLVNQIQTMRQIANSLSGNEQKT